MNQEKFKKLLEGEKVRLEGELATIGRRNPDNKSDWEAVEPADLNTDQAEEGEVAESMEVFENNTAILAQLETQLKEVNDALQKMDEGKYGICEVCGKEIEEDRLS